ncbi:MAG: copper-translocating P-type ATPase [Ignavibacteriae bacterium]|nr:copper-translocating P-type ATPase [Ignavibacteriota bacterium]
MNHKHNHKHHDHTEHHRMMIKDFKKKFFISLVLTFPILLFSPLIQGLLGISIQFETMGIISFALASVIYFYGGQPFLKGLKEEVSNKNPGMMTLIGIAITVAWAYSSAVTFGLKGMPFYWELATLIDIMLLGHWIEMKSIVGTSGALQELVKLMPSDAHLIKDGVTKDVKLNEIKKGDTLLIKANEKVPADGIIVDGDTYIDESMISGESKPVKKSNGDKVTGGTINGNSSIKIEVRNSGDDSYLNKVIKMVRDAQAVKSKTQNLADKAAKWLTYVAISVGTITFLVWLLAGQELQFALERMVSVMVITCPHALGLAIPLVVAISTTISAKNGLLIRNRTAFENSGKITSLVFDKTGTLTHGKFGVDEIRSTSNLSKEELLSITASLEENSEHPIAQSIVKDAKEKQLILHKVIDFESITGKGISGTIKEKNYSVVSPKFLTENNIEIPELDIKTELGTTVYLISESKVLGAISLADRIRKESYDAIKDLQSMNIKCYMATGDNEKVAKAVSNELELDGYYSEVLPEDKVRIVSDLQEKDEFVAMTGDGVNDSPALAQANIGIAIGSGTDVAAETADIILVESNPKDIVHLLQFGEATRKKMIQNITWATGYNVIAVPLAAGVLYPSIVLDPAIGAAVMSLSTIIVAANAQLLKLKLKKGNE